MTLMDGYKRANEALHPTDKAVEGALSGGAPRKRRRPLRAAIPAAVAVAVALALVITGLPGPGTPGNTALAAHALAEPVYPDLPHMPTEPTADTEAAWEQFSEDYDTYLQAWKDFQDEVPALYEREDLLSALEGFTGTSTALALAGEGNGVYSPVSLWFALAMLAETVDGDSRQEILDALGASDLEQLREWADVLWHDLYLDNGTASVLLGTSLWLNEGMNFRQETVDALAEHYYAGSYQVPMGADEADDALSAWTAERTRGLIGSDGKVLETTPDTLMVLASTLYAMGRWSDEFRAENNTDDVFTAADGTEQMAEFMHRTDDSTFLRREGYQAAYLYTTAAQVLFVLPDEGVSPRDLLADPDLLGSLDFESGDAIYGEVQWSLPKFDVRSDLDLKPTLKGLGIASVLDPGVSDFSPLTSLEPVWLDQAKQIARVQVDELGFQAAAVTLLAAAGSGAPPEDPKICVMDLDRPFLFVIRSGDAVLFAGVVDSLA